MKASERIHPGPERRPGRAGRRERGLSIISLLLISVVIVACAMLTMKVVPALTEFWNVRKIVSTMASSGDLRTGGPADIRRSFDRRATIDYVESITGKDLDIRKTGDGYGVSFRYEKRIFLFGNVYLLFDFAGNGEDRARGS